MNMEWLLKLWVFAIDKNVQAAECKQQSRGSKPAREGRGVTVPTSEPHVGERSIVLLLLKALPGARLDRTPYESRG
jgi:hypothetical protein